MDFDLLVTLAILLVLLVICIIMAAVSRRSKNKTRSAEPLAPEAPPAPASPAPKRQVKPSVFTTAELAGSSLRDAYEKMQAAGLTDMLPRLWALMTGCDDRSRSFIFACGDTALEAVGVVPDLDGVKRASFYPMEEGAEIPPVLQRLIEHGGGVVILLPSDPTEFILSLGAQAYLRRLYGDNLRVRIAAPAAMGAFWSAANITRPGLSRVSFAYGEADDCLCCDISVEDGICEITSLAPSPVMRPPDTATALERIARGTLLQCGVMTKQATGLLIDMFPYNVSLLLKEDGRVIQVITPVPGPKLIPAKEKCKNIRLIPGMTLSLLLAGHELIDDLLARCGLPPETISVTVSIDSDMAIGVTVSSSSGTAALDLGSQIG